MKTILESVQYLHERNIVHRDLHPDNFVFRTETDETDVVLIDFGWSVKLQPNKKLHLPLFVPPFISPESTQPVSAGYDTKQDIFALGSILFYMLTGKLIYRCENEQEMK